MVVVVSVVVMFRMMWKVEKEEDMAWVGKGRGREERRDKRIMEGSMDDCWDKYGEVIDMQSS